ncbi:MAG: HAMP domain-containing histidine kinase [Patescibacteria group bacterium]|nr:HAMP domain-containing histidine kinase [Patescibacteria group bacterium]MDE2015352.1 HAMP domain-containing histidine kinase [Patescibacteria group bacterium]MDE2227157.1 HAMP domain-containing histidine kinase [Patescibacteria group bacterium]
MFKKARLKLTAFYLLIIVVIITAFSLLLFRYTAQHLRDNMEEDSSQRVAVLERTIGELGYAIIIADGIVIAFAGLLSYWLAGRTLEPIGVALEAQEQFSANASHELRTPLSVVKNDVEVFLKKQQPTMEDAKAVASRSLEEIDRMSGMVENLLTLARSKKTDVPIELEETNVAKAIDVAVKKLQRSAEAKHLSLVVKKENVALVLGNERLLEQLFFNLIQNAITYTKEGSVTVAITASKVVTVQVADTGIGIDQKELGHIFEPFYKADASRTSRSNGVGLGLAIVKEIVDKHKGSIQVESAPGKGTEVTVTFPLWDEKAS